LVPVSKDSARLEDPVVLLMEKEVAAEVPTLPAAS
jgi:hypothetical protein